MNVLADRKLQSHASRLQQSWDPAGQLLRLEQDFKRPGNLRKSVYRFRDLLPFRMPARSHRPLDPWGTPLARPLLDPLASRRPWGKGAQPSAVYTLPERGLTITPGRASVAPLPSKVTTPFTRVRRTGAGGRVQRQVWPPRPSGTS